MDGDLKFSSIGNVNCDCGAPGSGVTFVIIESAPGLAGEFEFSSIDSLSLRAPSASSYDYPGMLIHVDRGASSGTSKFNSNQLPDHERRRLRVVADAGTQQHRP